MANNMDEEMKQGNPQGFRPMNQQIISHEKYKEYLD